MKFVRPKLTYLSTSTNTIGGSRYYTPDNRFTYLNVITDIDGAIEYKNDAYYSSTVYNTGDKVDRHAFTYQCLQDGVQYGVDPGVDHEQTEWMAVGFNNKYAICDNSLYTTSKFGDYQNNTCTYTFSVGGSNTIAFLGMRNVAKITVQQYESSTAVTKGTPIGDPVVYDLWNDKGDNSLYNYWYNPIAYKQDFILMDLQVFPYSHLNVTFEKVDDYNVDEGEIGCVVTGLGQDLGVTLYGTKVKMKDYSTYETDTNGNVLFNRKPIAKTVTGSIVVDTDDIDDVFYQLAEVRGEPTLYILDKRSDGLKSLMVLGYVEDLEIPVETPEKSKFPIKIIGVA